LILGRRIVLVLTGDAGAESGAIEWAGRIREIL